MSSLFSVLFHKLSEMMKTIQGDLSSLDLELHDAGELAQNRQIQTYHLQQNPCD